MNSKKAKQLRKAAKMLTVKNPDIIYGVHKLNKNILLHPNCTKGRNKILKAKYNSLKKAGAK